MLELAARSVAFGHEGYTTTRGDRVVVVERSAGCRGENVVGKKGCGTAGEAGREVDEAAAVTAATAGGEPRVYVASSQ